tara:strand:+ start:746 stop:976 length:231 start_codon:yes stop_codon:yes gene_type:complete
MTKKIIITPQNPKGIVSDFTAEELAEKEISDNKASEILNAMVSEIETKKSNQASAKAKLIAGEKLTEEEADILIGV